jgi:hypothetical protein
LKRVVVHSRDAPDTDFAAYPANLKAGYRISGRMSGAGRIFNSTFKRLVKYEINKDIRCIEGFLFLS